MGQGVGESVYRHSKGAARGMKMSAVRKERRQFINLRRLIMIVSALALLGCCAIAWHFANAPRPVENSHHRLDTPVYRCLGCHYFGNTSRKMTHRVVSFCFPCHRPRKPEQQK